MAISTPIDSKSTFVPTKDLRTRRRSIYTERGDYEVLTTGCKWYDTRAKVGGGGAMDPAMHVLSLTFVDAVKRLISSADSDEFLSFLSPLCRRRERFPNDCERLRKAPHRLSA